MIFSIDFSARNAIGFLTTVMALTALFMCITVAEGGGIIFLLLFSLLLALISSAIFSADYLVSLDKDNALITKSFGALGLDRKQQYQLADFNEVGIMMAGRPAAKGGSTTIYYVQLIGKENVKLPGGLTDLDEIISSAQTVADYLSLPFDEKPKMGFFGKRL